MDDVPAGPASPEPRRPSLSVVIPVHNGGRDFEHCLRRLRDSLQTDFELIVVDDGSTDDSAALAESFGAVVCASPRPLGPAAARNAGAQAASAPHDLLPRRRRRRPSRHARPRRRAVRGRSGADGPVRLVRRSPTAPGLVSQFRNLLHHYVHQQGDSSTRPAGPHVLDRLRRDPADVFLDFGGFDPRLYRRPAIEDIELGYRLTRAGCRIILVRDVQATHMKRWTLQNMIRTDIFQRGVPWMLLMKRSRIAETDLNVKPGPKLCVVSAGLIGMSLVAAPFFPWLLVRAPGPGGRRGNRPARIVDLNRKSFNSWFGVQASGFALRRPSLHFVYYCCCGFSVMIALVYSGDSPSPRLAAPEATAENPQNRSTRWLRGPQPATHWK